MTTSPEEGDETTLRQLVGAEQLHAAFTTRPDEVAAVVGRVTAREMVGQERIARGIDNEVHAVTIADGASLFVHIRRHGELPFADIRHYQGLLIGWPGIEA